MLWVLVLLMIDLEGKHEARFRVLFLLGGVIEEAMASFVNGVKLELMADAHFQNVGVDGLEAGVGVDTLFEGYTDFFNFDLWIGFWNQFIHFYIVI